MVGPKVSCARREGSRPTAPSHYSQARHGPFVWSPSPTPMPIELVFSFFKVLPFPDFSLMTLSSDTVMILLHLVSEVGGGAGGWANTESPRYAPLSPQVALVACLGVFIHFDRWMGSDGWLWHEVVSTRPALARGAMLYLGVLSPMIFPLIAPRRPSGGGATTDWGLSVARRT